MGSRELTERAEQTASRYIAQRETGPWSETDAAEMQRWLAEAPLHRVVYYRLHAAWQEAGRLQALQPQRPQAPVRQVDRGSRLRRAGRVAGLALAAGVVLFLVVGPLLPNHQYATVVGGLQAVPMSDGSRVTLNTDSRLRISLGKYERRVDLDHGEAYFEVAHDAVRPFVVRVGNKRIVAIGTQFSVRRDGDDISVSVTEGLVRFENEDRRANATTAEAQRDVLLPAGTVAHEEQGNVLVQQRSLSEVQQALTWRNGILTFHDTPLAEAVAEFNRYNERKIVIRDPAVGAIPVGGIFGATQPSPFVHLLEQALPIRATETPEQIVLNAK